MKVTIHFAGSTSYMGGGGSLSDSYSANVYLNGELIGWSSWFDNFELENVPEGENIVEIEGTRKIVGKRKIRFTAKQDVKIWVRQQESNIEILVKGEDIKILENVVIKERWGEEEITEGPPLDGKPREEEKKKAEEKPKESLWESFKKINDDLLK